MLMVKKTFTVGTEVGNLFRILFPYEQQIPEEPLFKEVKSEREGWRRWFSFENQQDIYSMEKEYPGGTYYIFDLDWHSLTKTTEIREKEKAICTLHEYFSICNDVPRPKKEVVHVDQS
jgi:hypothetical protein